MAVVTKRQARLRRRRRVRARIVGTAERPRLSVYRSNRGVFAQLIDDGKGHTVAAVNWIEPDLRKLSASDQAKKAGELLAERAKAAEDVRERSMAKYHLFEYSSAALQVAIVVASASIITGVPLLALLGVGLGLVAGVLGGIGWLAPDMFGH